MLLLGGVIALLLAELALRVFGIGHAVFLQADPICGWAHIPGAEGWYTSEGRSYVRINRDGWRDREHPKDKPPETFRIAVLGDSYPEAFQLPEEKSFVSVLAESLAATAGRGKTIEVLNFGVSGYGTAQEYLALHHKVWPYSPDAVLLALLTGNDVADNSRELRRMAESPYFVYRDGELVLDDSFLRCDWYRSRRTSRFRFLTALVNHSRVLQVINSVRRRRNVAERAAAWQGGQQKHDLAEVGLDDMIYVEPKTEEWKAAWQVTEGLLQRMGRECKAKRAPLFIVTLSNSIQVHPDPARRKRLKDALGVGDLFYPDRRIKAFGDRHGIPVLNLAPAFQVHAEKHKVFLHGFGKNPGTGHWNEAGHRLGGERIARWLRRRIAE